MPITHIVTPANFGDLTPESTDAEIRACPEVRKDYGALLDKYPDHPVILDGLSDGRCLRWKANKVVCLMTSHESKNRVDLNQLWKDFFNQETPIEDMATVYRMMGYSLCGFIEIFGEYFSEI